jgi:hypothetical protein
MLLFKEEIKLLIIIRYNYSVERQKRDFNLNN